MTTLSNSQPDMWMLVGSVFMNVLLGAYNSIKTSRIDRNVTAANGSVPASINTLNDVVTAISKQMNDLTEESKNTTVRDFETRLNHIESLLEDIRNDRNTPPEQSAKN